MLKWIKESPWLQTTLTVILALYFISGVFNQSLAIGMPGKAHHSEIWHIFHLTLGLTCLFSVLFRARIGYWWLVTIFLWQIPVEIYGAYYALSHGLDETGQMIEPLFNMFGLAFTYLTRLRYAAKA